ncbi:reverse transcriptase domain-containing protein [Tanacetum coccineum]
MEDEFKTSVQPQRRVNPNIKEVMKKEVIQLFDAGLIYPISDSPWVSPIQFVPKKGGMAVVKNEKNELIPQRTDTGWSVFLGYFQILIAPEDQEKTTFTCTYDTFAYKRMPYELCNTPTTFQRCMTTIFHELIDDSMEVFMDDFSVFSSSFDHCLKNLEKMIKRCEETNLMLNWEKYHFMVKEGIVLVHKVFGSGIEVDKAKIKAISKLPYLINVKAIRSFLGHAGFYRRFIKDFSQVPIMIKPDWSLPFEIICDVSDYAVRAILGQKFDIEIRDKKGAENLAADHLSRLENPDLGKLTKAEIRDLFLEERLMRSKSYSTIRGIIYGMSHSYSNNVQTESYEGVSPEMRRHKSFNNVIAAHQEDIMVLPQPQGKSSKPGSTGQISFAMHVDLSELACNVQRAYNYLLKEDETPSKV